MLWVWAPAHLQAAFGARPQHTLAGSMSSWAPAQTCRRRVVLAPSTHVKTGSAMGLAPCTHLQAGLWVLDPAHICKQHVSQAPANTCRQDYGAGPQHTLAGRQRCGAGPQHTLCRQHVKLGSSTFRQHVEPGSSTHRQRLQASNPVGWRLWQPNQIGYLLQCLLQAQPLTLVVSCSSLHFVACHCCCSHACRLSPTWTEGRVDIGYTVLLDCAQLLVDAL